MASPEIQGIITIPTQLEEQIKSRLSAYFKKYRYKTKKGREKEKVEREREREGGIFLHDFPVAWTFYC